MGSSKRQLKLHDPLPLSSEKRGELRASFSPRLTHGGKEAKGRRKSARPFSPKAPTHIVLTSLRAQGLWSLKHRKNQAKIQSQIYVYAARFKVQIYRTKNLGTELHLLVKCDDRKRMADYLRVLAGRIAISVTGARKHIKKIGKFWDSLCWSRLVNFGADFYQTRLALIEGTTEVFESSLSFGVLNAIPRAKG